METLFEKILMIDEVPDGLLARYMTGGSPTIVFDPDKNTINKISGDCEEILVPMSDTKYDWKDILVSLLMESIDENNLQQNRTVESLDHRLFNSTRTTYAIAHPSVEPNNQFERWHKLDNCPKNTVFLIDHPGCIGIFAKNSSSTGMCIMNPKLIRRINIVN